MNFPASPMLIHTSGWWTSIQPSPKYRAVEQKANQHSQDVILILEEEDPESAARIMEAVAADMQSSGWAVLRTPANAFIAICEGMEHHFLPCKEGYVMKVYSEGEVSYHADVQQHIPEHE